MTPPNHQETLEQTTEIVSSYVSNNHVPREELVKLIGEVFGALKGVGVSKAEAKAEAAAPVVPAVPIRKSITPDHLISLEDGRSYKSLKRHLKVQYGMTPEEYRAKWGLPSDYPMVAPNYAAKRSQVALQTGLGRKSRS
ncbi:transcriptional regulator [Aureimonas ureilytica]|uniref:Transcriptional regulator n=1 Tax=Aureimonas ureilytica TaxID=401562 RepID=A0A175RHX3_9HYPH|nr:MucR family transcriptional regulator [Aureimonas ureilytica]KTR02991.1 transcriptional regulator [Aureimonas ureilytica]